MSPNIRHVQPTDSPIDEIPCQDILDTLPEFICRYNTNAIITYVNIPYCRLFDKSPKELIGQSIFNFAPPQAHSHLGQVMTKIPRDAQPFEHPVYMPNGEVRWHQWIDQTIVDSDGQVIAFQAIGRDITDRKRAEEAHARSEARYHLLAHNLPNMAVILFDSDLRYTLVEGSILEAAGYSKAVMEGHTIWEVLPPASVAALEPHYRAALAGKEQSFERQSEGRIYEGLMLPLHELDGTISGGMLVIHDITLQHQQEITLRESEEKFRQFAEHSERVFWMVDLKTNRIIYLNPAFEKIWGVSRLEIAGDLAKIIGAVHPEDRHLLAEVQQEPTGEGYPDVQYRIIRPDGTIRWVSSLSFPIRDANGTIHQLGGIAEDITERKQIEQERFEMMVKQEEIRLLTDFIQNTSHEFRTPLAVINSSLYLARKIDDPLKREQKFTQIENQVKQLTRLIENLHEMSQLDIGQTLTMSLLDMKPLVERVCDLARETAEAKQLKLTVNLESDLPQVRGDEGYVSQAITNVLENAILYTRPNGTIQVRMYAHEGMLMIDIRDTGIGISPTDLPHIFERFYKVDKARTSGKSGAGLGLSIARQVIEQHGGRITVESEPGIGSLFRIMLPLSPST